MHSKFLSVFDYSAWVLKRYTDLHQAHEKNVYRIVEIKRSETGEYVLVTQVIGKSTLIECLPREVVAIDHLIEGFSKKDIRTITFLACEQVAQPQYKIVMQEFCEQFNKMSFKLRDAQSETVISKTAADIVKDKELINSLSREDVSSISYMAGYECSQHDR